MQASLSDTSDRRMVRAPAQGDGADITNDVFEYTGQVDSCRGSMRVVPRIFIRPC